MNMVRDTMTRCAFLFICGIACVLGSRHHGERGQHHRPGHLSKIERQHLQDLWYKYGPDYSAYEKTEIDYPCGPLPKSPSVPTSVHRLRPGDINVVGALGDSLTAGTGLAAITLIGDAIQYRGLTWSGGGQSDYEDQITVPNILKKYNPDVYGYATGNGDEDSRRSFFNVAVSGSKSGDLVAQARELIDRMKDDPKVDVAKDWKVVTILSGNNDLCDYCWNKDDYNVHNFRANLMEALDLLHAELPRTLVNLVEPLNVEIVKDLNKGLICAAVHLYACDCAAFPLGDEAERKMILETDLYQVAVEEIAKSGRYDSDDDFTVVYQPFLNGTYLPMREDGQPDLSYFAPDCFHLSRKGQAAAASALWNNMVEPVGKKRTMWSPGEPIECPDETRPFIYTNKNSDAKQGQLLAGTPSPLSAQGEAAGAASSASFAVPVAVCAVLAAVAFIVLVVVIRRRVRHHGYQRV